MAAEAAAMGIWKWIGVTATGIGAWFGREKLKEHSENHKDITNRIHEVENQMGINNERHEQNTREHSAVLDKLDEIHKDISKQALDAREVATTLTNHIKWEEKRFDDGK